MPGQSTSSPTGGSYPVPPSERGPWLFALALAVLAVLLLAGALSGRIAGESGSPPPSGPAAAVPAPSARQAASVVARATTPGVVDAALVRPSAAQVGHVSRRGRSKAGLGVRRGAGRAAQGDARAIVAQPSLLQQQADAPRLLGRTRTHIAACWLAGFYPIYSAAQSTFGVNWLLLASIHRQETAFSTAPGTYHGLNFVHCCGGPMQFNVTNGPVSTWRLVEDGYRYGSRPRVYGHMTATHPSIYDDFDAVMAAGWLLSADGARRALDAGAWVAAYDYYGHDLTGVGYADQVLARAIGWSQHGFCINCGVTTALIEAVHAAYGAPVARALTAATIARTHRRH